MEETNHVRCALVMPGPYQGKAYCYTSGCERSVVELATELELSPLLDRVGGGAICMDGLCCLTTPYEIEACRLDQEDWVEHIAQKQWCARTEFARALARAQEFKRAGYLRDHWHRTDET